MKDAYYEYIYPREINLTVIDLMRINESNVVSERRATHARERKRGRRRIGFVFVARRRTGIIGGSRKGRDAECWMSWLIEFKEIYARHRHVARQIKRKGKKRGKKKRAESERGSLAASYRGDYLRTVLPTNTLMNVSTAPINVIAE